MHLGADGDLAADDASKCGHQRHADIIGRTLHPLVNVAYPWPQFFWNEREVEMCNRQEAVGQRMRLWNFILRLAVRLARLDDPFVDGKRLAAYSVHGRTTSLKSKPRSRGVRIVTSRPALAHRSAHRSAASCPRPLPSASARIVKA